MMTANAPRAEEAPLTLAEGDLSLTPTITLNTNDTFYNLAARMTLYAQKEGPFKIAEAMKPAQLRQFSCLDAQAVYSGFGT